MYTKKEYGGLDFRDFYGFNLAMLEKQGWKLLSDPNALISRIYKARYYPRGGGGGRNPSFLNFSKKWALSLKSRYRLPVNSLTSNVDLHVPRQWEMIWTEKVPSKIKFCLWKAYRDVLPMRCRLQTKGVVVPLTCVLCDSDVENCWHVFVTCPFARQCWVEVAKLARPSGLARSARN